MKTIWVGIRKDRYTNHAVFKDKEHLITPEKYKNYDYTIGPFKTIKEAKRRAKIERNKTGTFTDPFCNNGQGR